MSSNSVLKLSAPSSKILVKASGKQLRADYRVVIRRKYKVTLCPSPPKTDVNQNSILRLLTDKL